MLHVGTSLVWIEKYMVDFCLAAAKIIQRTFHSTFAVALQLAAFLKKLFQSV